MDLNKTVNFNCEKFNELERDRAEKERNIIELQKNVNDMCATAESLKDSLDRQGQHSRRNWLLFYGELFIDIIKEKLKEETKRSEID